MALDAQPMDRKCQKDRSGCLAFSIAAVGWWNKIPIGGFVDSQADLGLDHFAGNRGLIVGEVLDQGVVRTEFLRKNSTQGLYRQGLSGAGRQPIGHKFFD
jgi:hypothetical protein